MGLRALRAGGLVALRRLLQVDRSSRRQNRLGFGRPSYAVTAHRAAAPAPIPRASDIAVFRRGRPQDPACCHSAAQLVALRRLHAARRARTQQGRRPAPCHPPFGRSPKDAHARRPAKRREPASANERGRWNGWRDHRPSIRFRPAAIPSLFVSGTARPVTARWAHHDQQPQKPNHADHRPSANCRSPLCCSRSFPDGPLSHDTPPALGPTRVLSRRPSLFDSHGFPGRLARPFFAPRRPGTLNPAVGNRHNCVRSKGLIRSSGAARLPPSALAMNRITHLPGTCRWWDNCPIQHQTSS